MYFVPAYVETALVESVALTSTTPVALIGDSSPSASDTGDAVAGTTYWNSFDSVNGNSFVYDSRKICMITNSDATDSVNVTIQTLNDTTAGFTRTISDMVVAVAAGELAIVPNLPNLFKDGTLVNMTIAEDGGTAITDTRIAVVKIT